MIFQFHNIIPGLIFEKGSAKLNFSDPKVVEGLDGFRGRLALKRINVEPAGLSLEEKYLKGLYAIEEVLQETEAEIWGLKGQITGPLTEAYSIEILPWKRKAILDEEIFKIILNTTSEIAYWLSKRLQKLTKKFVGKEGETIVFLDEPLLPLSLKETMDPETRINSINYVLNRIQCRKGVHICDNPITVIDNMLELDIDYFSFDARRYPATLEKTKGETLQRYLEKGKGFAFGLTPNSPEELFGEEHIYEIQRGKKDPTNFIPEYIKIKNGMKKMVLSVESKVDVVSLLEQSLVTPQCGFRNFNIPDPEMGEQVVKSLLEIQEKAAKEVRDEYKIN
ncbi:MAG: hypothetical protein ACETWM_11100 [Candidatus Lokiarchaeia archaeon]